MDVERGGFGEGGIVIYGLTRPGSSRIACYPLRYGRLFCAGGGVPLPLRSRRRRARGTGRIVQWECSLAGRKGHGTNQALLDSLLDLLNLDLTEALDLQESSAGGTMNGLDSIISALVSIVLFQWMLLSYCHSVKSVGFQFGDISCTDAVGLDAVDVDDEILCQTRSAIRRMILWGFIHTSSLNSSPGSEAGILDG